MRKASLTILFFFILICPRQVQADEQLSVAIITPQNGAYTYPDFELRWSLSGKVNRTEIYVDGKAFKTDLDPSKSSYYLFGLENGSRKILVRVVGGLDESAEDSVTVTVLTASLDLVIVSPKEGSFTNASFVNIVWNATGPIKLIKFWSSEYQDTASLDKDRRSYNLTLRSQGQIEARVYVVDLRGPTIVKSVAFVHDSVPPTVNITSPMDGQTIDRSFVTVIWECFDNISAISKAEIRVDGITLSDHMSGEKYLTNLSDGEHLLNLLAIDAAGNKAEKNMRFFVSVPFWARYGMIAWLFIIVGVGIFLLIQARAARR